MPSSGQARPSPDCNCSSNVVASTPCAAARLESRSAPSARLHRRTAARPLAGGDGLGDPAEVQAGRRLHSGRGGGLHASGDRRHEGRRARRLWRCPLVERLAGCGPPAARPTYNTSPGGAVAGSPDTRTGRHMAAPFRVRVWHCRWPGGPRAYTTRSAERGRLSRAIALPLALLARGPLRSHDRLVRTVASRRCLVRRAVAGTTASDVSGTGSGPLCAAAAAGGTGTTGWHASAVTKAATSVLFRK